MTIKTIEERLSTYIPIPLCIVSENGKVVSANDHISQVFIYDGIKDADFFALTGIKLDQLEKAGRGEYTPIIYRNKKSFKVAVTRDIEASGQVFYLAFFHDITSYEELKDRYTEEKMCVAKIVIDNYEEFVAKSSDENRMAAFTKIEQLVRQFATKAETVANKGKEHQYTMYFHKKFLASMIETKFSILDDIRQIEIDTDFPMSLSIGIGIGGENLAETEELAEVAMQLALGRGGDQAVIKENSNIKYFGGKLQTVEKSNKGKARVVAHALKQLILQSKNVIIMGHYNPDHDSFGACLGLYRICQILKKEAYIIINNVSDSLRPIYSQAVDSDNYKIITNHKVESLASEDTLCIILDTHRRSMVECDRLLDICSKTVVIDHHRRAEDWISDAILAYIETYASSTCELVTELIQYIGNTKTLIKLEAEALLAGMTIDTNRFAVRTGVRTFEAAAWLRRSGADTAEVKRFFQTDLSSFKVKAKCIAAADIDDIGIVTSVCEGNNQDAQIIHSQVADELLNIKGIRASFVAGRNEMGRTVVSARSLGDINVQVIMEKIGGGGHLTMAGAQVKESPEEIISILKGIVMEMEDKNQWK